MGQSLKSQILELFSQGKTQKEITQLLNCSKSTVSYHLNPNGKAMTRERLRRFRSKAHPLLAKVNGFNEKVIYNRKHRDLTSTPMQRLNWKLKRFYDGRAKDMITLEQALDKFGDSPKCYLTGTPIDLTKTHTYELDHVIPRSRGGDNSIDNLGLVTKEANQAKRAMTDKEFIALCKMVAEHNK